MMYSLYTGYNENVNEILNKLFCLSQPELAYLVRNMPILLALAVKVHYFSRPSL